MARLFFGLCVEQELGDRIVRTTRAGLEGCEGVQAYSSDDLHLTLAFLGEVAEERVASMLRSAGEEFRGLTAPELTIGGSVGAFPSTVEPRALWEGVDETFDSIGRLEALRSRAWQVAYSHGLRPTRAELARPFRPHVTVARSAAGSDVPEDFFDERDERRWLPVDVCLFESHSGRGDGGARYLVRGAWPLVVRPG